MERVDEATRGEEATRELESKVLAAASVRDVGSARNLAVTERMKQLREAAGERNFHTELGMYMGQLMEACRVSGTLSGELGRGGGGGSGGTPLPNST